MRTLAALGAALGALGFACGGTGAPRPPATPAATPAAAPAAASEDLGVETHAALAAPDGYRPSYGPDALERALVAERAAAASAAARIAALEAAGDDDALRVARADLAVRRRFVGELEACRATGQRCPPRLDDPPWRYDLAAGGAPPLDATLRFDLADWRAIAAELFGRACACRTLACVDSLDAVIDDLETRPMPDVDGDELASTSITRARECLSWLRGAARPGG